MSAAFERSTSMRNSGLFSRRSTFGETMPGFFAISSSSRRVTAFRFS
jgi:hypothetical protein